jgi:uncharacterized protein YuzE
MRVTYDPTADAMYLYLTDRSPGSPEVARTQEIADGLTLDFDQTGNVIGIEVLAVSDRPGANPLNMTFEVLTERPPKPAEAA